MESSGAVSTTVLNAPQSSGSCWIVRRDRRHARARTLRSSLVAATLTRAMKGTVRAPTVFARLSGRATVGLRSRNERSVATAWMLAGSDGHVAPSEPGGGSAGVVAWCITLAGSGPPSSSIAAGRPSLR
jgi:hypothetical protein